MITVACLMPTIPSHQRFLSRAVDSFLKQDFPGDWDVQLVIDADPKATLGAKLNRMIAGTCAQYVVLLDDDDYHSPTRVRRQVEPLLNGYDLTGTSKIYYHNVKTDEAYLFSCDPKDWLGGMAFKRTLWERLPFQDKTQGVDTCWQRAAKPLYYDVADPTLFIASIHDSNSGGAKRTLGPRWSEVPVEQLGWFPRL